MSQTESIKLCIELANTFDRIISGYQSSLEKVLHTHVQEIEPTKSEAIEEIEMKHSYALEDEKKIESIKNEAGGVIGLKHLDDLEADKKTERHELFTLIGFNDPRQSQFQLIHEEFTSIIFESSRKFTEAYEGLTKDFFGQEILQTIDPYQGLSLFILKLMRLLSENDLLYRFYNKVLGINSDFTINAIVNNFITIQVESQKSFWLFGCFGDLLDPAIDFDRWKYWARSVGIEFYLLGCTYTELFKSILLSQKFIKKYGQAIPGLTPEIYKIAIDTALLRTRVVSILPKTDRGFTTSNLWIFIEDMPIINQALRI